jgi:hypothetical protein
MGFAWMPDNGADAHGQLYPDDQRYYRSASARPAIRNPAGRHALSHSQRPLLPRFGAGKGAHASRLPDVPRRPSGWSGPGRWRRWA